MFRTTRSPNERRQSSGFMDRLFSIRSKLNLDDDLPPPPPLPSLGRTLSQKYRSSAHDDFCKRSCLVPDCAEKTIWSLAEHFKFTYSLMSSSQIRQEEGEPPALLPSAEVQVLLDNLKEQLQREGYESKLSVMDAFGSVTHALVDPSLYQKIQEKLWEATSISNSYYTGLRNRREQFKLDLADASEKVQAHLIPLLQRTLDPNFAENFDTLAADILSMKKCLIERQDFREKTNIAAVVEEISSIWREICSNYQQTSERLLREIRKLDCDLVIALLKQTASVAALIADKDILLLLGPTGTGKSTTIHHLAGTRFQREMCGPSNQQVHMAPILPEGSGDPNQLGTMSSVITSPWMTAQTTTINCVRIPHRDGSLNLCDSPGFDDTRFVEMKVANNISLCRALKRCRSIRPIILLCKDTFMGRYTGLADQCSVYAQLFDRIEEQLPSFSFFFTKVPESTSLSEIEALIQDKSSKIMEELSRPLRREEAAVMDAIVGQMKNRRNAMIINLNTADQRSITASLDYVLSRPPISNPSEVIREFTDTHELNSQLSLHEWSVRQCLTNCGDERSMSVLNYKLRQLSQLTRLTSLPECQKTYLECQSLVFSQMIETSDDMMNRLQSFLLQDSKMFPSSAKEYFQSHLRIFWLEEARRHIHSNSSHASPLIDDLSAALQEVACRNLLAQSKHELKLTLRKWSEDLLSPGNPQGWSSFLHLLNGLVVLHAAAHQICSATSSNLELARMKLSQSETSESSTYLLAPLRSSVDSMSRLELYLIEVQALLEETIRDRCAQLSEWFDETLTKNELHLANKQYALFMKDFQINLEAIGFGFECHLNYNRVGVEVRTVVTETLNHFRSIFDESHAIALDVICCLDGSNDVDSSPLEFFLTELEAILDLNISDDFFVADSLQVYSDSLSQAIAAHVDNVFRPFNQPSIDDLPLETFPTLSFHLRRIENLSSIEFVRRIVSPKLIENQRLVRQIFSKLRDRVYDTFDSLSQEWEDAQLIACQRCLQHTFYGTLYLIRESDSFESIQIVIQGTIDKAKQECDSNFGGYDFGNSTSLEAFKLSFPVSKKLGVLLDWEVSPFLKSRDYLRTPEFTKCLEWSREIHTTAVNICSRAMQQINQSFLLSLNFFSGLPQFRSMAVEDFKKMKEWIVYLLTFSTVSSFYDSDEVKTAQDLFVGGQLVFERGTVVGRKPYLVRELLEVLLKQVEEGLVRDYTWIIHFSIPPASNSVHLLSETLSKYNCFRDVFEQLWWSQKSQSETVHEIISQYCFKDIRKLNDLTDLIELEPQVRSSHDYFMKWAVRLVQYASFLLQEISQADPQKLEHIGKVANKMKALDSVIPDSLLLRENSFGAIESCAEINMREQGDTLSRWIETLRFTQEMNDTFRAQHGELLRTKKGELQTKLDAIYESARNKLEGNQPLTFACWKDLHRLHQAQRYVSEFINDCKFEDEIKEVLSQRQRSLGKCGAPLRRKLENFDFVSYEKTLQEYQEIDADLSGFDWTAPDSGSMSTIGTVISDGYQKAVKEFLTAMLTYEKKWFADLVAKYEKLQDNYDVEVIQVNLPDIKFFGSLDYSDRLRDAYLPLILESMISFLDSLLDNISCVLPSDVGDQVLIDENGIESNVTIVEVYPNGVYVVKTSSGERLQVREIRRLSAVSGPACLPSLIQCEQLMELFRLEILPKTVYSATARKFKRLKGRLESTRKTNEMKLTENLDQKNLGGLVDIYFEMSNSGDRALLLNPRSQILKYSEIFCQLLNDKSMSDSLYLLKADIREWRRFVEKSKYYFPLVQVLVSFLAKVENVMNCFDSKLAINPTVLEQRGYQLDDFDALLSLLSGSLQETSLPGPIVTGGWASVKSRSLDRVTIDFDSSSDVPNTLLHSALLSLSSYDDRGNLLRGRDLLAGLRNFVARFVLKTKDWTMSIADGQNLLLDALQWATETGVNRSWKDCDVTLSSAVEAMVSIRMNESYLASALKCAKRIQIPDLQSSTLILNEDESIDKLFDFLLQPFSAALQCCDTFLFCEDYFESNLTNTPNSSDRDKFYLTVNACCFIRSKLALLVQNNPKIAELIPPTPRKIDEFITDQLDNISDLAEQSLKRIFGSLSRGALENNSLEILDRATDHLRSMSASLTQVQSQRQNAKSCLAKFLSEFKRFLSEFSQQSFLFPEVQDFLTHEQTIIDRLVGLKSTSIKVQICREVINSKIDEIMRYFTEKGRAGQQFVGRIGATLKGRGPIGMHLLSDHTDLKMYAQYLENERFAKRSLENILSTIRGDSNLHVDTLRNDFMSFDELYKRLVENGLDQSTRSRYSDDLVTRAISLGRSISRQQETNSKLLELIASVFAIWTIDKAASYDKASTIEMNTQFQDSKLFLTRPHRGQVLTVLRFFGFGTQVPSVSWTNWVFTSAQKLFFDTERSGGISIPNHFIQMSTGEGKSVVLGITSVVLSLLGFQVECACYSEYLSRRDFDDFFPLFTRFNVAAHIRYGTFNAVCEKFINNRFDIRQTVCEFLSGEEPSTDRSSLVRPSILLIDEVDVFFSPQFYGSPYIPYAQLRSAEINSLMKSIWSLSKAHNVTGTLDPHLFRSIVDLVKASPEYGACVTKYHQWTTLLDDCLNQIIVDLLTYQSHEYLVENGRITYKESDRRTDKIFFRYKTMFAYFLHFDTGEVSSEKLEDVICLLFDCGAFAYSEIPKHFVSVLGVTGTLETLPDEEKVLLSNDYNVKCETIMPSAYGDRSQTLKFLNLEIVAEGDYFLRIAHEIRLRSQQGIRPVLVFFENLFLLENFRNSAEFESFRANALILSEGTKNRQEIIELAVEKGRVTLVTEALGRGTDFKCHDDEINGAGGLHIIQTFVCEDLSSEIQIRGRTARQGHEGSYSLILLDRDLEKFDLRELPQGATFQEIYCQIDLSRKLKFQTLYQNRQAYVDMNKAHHEESKLFYDHLKNKNFQSVVAFLKTRNRVEVCGDICSRTLCLIDGTGSMSNTLEGAKSTVVKMFKDTFQTLSEEGLKVSFEMLVGIYRNYNAPPVELFQHSDWETSPENIERFLGDIRPCYGIGNEAIEVAFQFLNGPVVSGKVSQVLLIGDAAPNTPHEVTKHRNKYKYGSSGTPFEVAANLQEELQKLIDAEVKVFTYNVGKNQATDTAFKKIADATGGQSSRLDVVGPSGANNLKETVVTKILEDIQNNTGRTDNSLVLKYQELISGGHVS